MKLYMHPVSITSRPVLLFIADNASQTGEIRMKSAQSGIPGVSKNPRPYGKSRGGLAIWVDSPASGY
jgi:hypothetical protein